MFRFTIRDVLWLTVVVAVSAGWWLEYRNRGPEYAKLRKENRQAEAAAKAKYDKLVKIHNAEVQSHRNSIKLFNDTNRMLEEEVTMTNAYAESIKKKYGFGK